MNVRQVMIIILGTLLLSGCAVYHPYTGYYGPPTYYGGGIGAVFVDIPTPHYPRHRHGHGSHSRGRR